MRKGRINVSPLQPGPIVGLRVEYQLTQEAAAERLGISRDFLRVLQMRSEVAPAVLDIMDRLLGPKPRFEQTSIWDALEVRGRVRTMRSGADLARRASRSRLLESPVAALRRRHGLMPDQTAAMLGISLRQLARLEASTRRIPASVMRDVIRAVTARPRFTQPSLFDHAGGDHVV